MKAFIVALILPAVALGQSMPGGITDTTVSKTDEPVVFAVNAINAHIAASNGGQPPNLVLIEVVRARTQVVAGEKLYLTLHLTGGYYCDITVWLRLDDRMQVTDGPTCRIHRSMVARNVAGGISEPKPVSELTEDSEAKGALDFAACQFAAVLGDVSGTTYTEQVTAGMTYRFSDVLLLESDCPNQGCDAVDLSSCSPKDGGMTQSCDFTVQSQAWMTPQYNITSIACVA